ncbi:uncharacterized protein LOC132057261 isoform X2 [Lycium ferocissimum]|uniref:uncharacterized protein LOC132057261 isoform X2 n=1 Tax=Lycium ferocissimum TaxID=112874 RepID=UPI0028165C3A|nr:uncharacterized protein LOC132057261 isoform X2 [Lycium ferocissimum]
MWPALVGAAAAAGSGFLAKKIFNQNATQHTSNSTESNIKCDKPNDLYGFSTPFHHKDSIFTSNCDKPSEPEGFNTFFQHKDSSFTSNFDKPSDLDGFNTFFQQKDSSFTCNCDKLSDPNGFNTFFQQKDSSFTCNCDKLSDPNGFNTFFQQKDSSFTSNCDKHSEPEGFNTYFQLKDSSFTCNCDKPSDLEGFSTYFQRKDSNFACDFGCSIQENSEGLSDESIFRFSSASGTEMGFRNLRKKNVEGCRKTKGNAMECKRNKSGGKLRKKWGNVRSGEKELFRLNGKRFYVCLKKRRTNKVPSGKCDSCASKGNSFFGYGLGIGMMCMMSAGKSEINRLNTTMDETAKAVEELKAELSRRKVAHDMRASKNKAEIGEKNDRECRIRAIAESSNENRNIYSEEGECGSSVVTEEPQPEVMEMDELEAELESELQKLPWCATDNMDLNGGRDPCKDDFLEKEFNLANDRNAETYQFNGVLPSELDQKLCHLLIEQQESQIVELESELHQTHSKLHEKEAELQALKDCVRRLTEFSLDVSPDEETDLNMEDEISGGGHQEKKIGPESGKSIVGMKRSMNF